MSVEEIVAVMHMDPVFMDMAGYTYPMVRKIETDIRTSLYASTLEQWDVERIWRSWYSLRIQMLLDDLEVCPPGYRWDPISLTC